MANTELASIDQKGNTHSTSDVMNVMIASSAWSAYYELIKPGITKMVVLSAAAGYYLSLSSPLHQLFTAPYLANFILTIIGTILVAAGSCVVNNYIERDYDKLMKRTVNRPIPSGRIQPFKALLFGSSISIIGHVVLIAVNWLTFALALLTWVMYVAIYTPLKRKSPVSLIVGAIPGALPTIGGWSAASGSLSWDSFLLFFILFFWQLPHFLSLSWMYRQDYTKGGFKMLAVIDPTGKKLALQTIVYIGLLTVVTTMMAITGTMGAFYLVNSLLLCSIFMYYGIRFYQEINPINARKVLISSYIYLMGVLLLIFVDKI